MIRLGATSYTYPADILTNVRKLAGYAQDIEIVLFEAAEDGSDLPQPAEVRELVSLAAGHDLTYTVHLPLDLGLAGPNPGLSRALNVVRAVAPLTPEAFVVHLEANVPDLTIKDWLRQSVSSLRILHDQIGDWKKICVENLETQAPEMMDAILEALPTSACLDVGHLWKQGAPGMRWIQSWIDRTRVIHLHGVGARDHKSLSLMPSGVLDPVVSIIDRQFDGILTFEVFNEKDLRDSRKAYNDALRRIRSRMRSRKIP